LPLKDLSFQKVDPSNLQLMEQIYRLRFDVYARQCKFIQEDDYPHELESDEYDPHSVHFAAIDRSGTVLATARMILPKEKSSPLLKSFPHLTKKHKIRKHSMVEISRFMVSKKLYQSLSEQQKLSKNYDSIRLSTKAAITKGLFQVIYHEIKSRGITHWCALMEKGLLMLLRLYGFKLRCVGEDVDVFGAVRPYVGNVSDFEKSQFKKFQAFNINITSTDI
jgi:N-acyl amino acid synthase of PEP-CTERM/exosortase system